MERVYHRVSPDSKPNAPLNVSRGESVRVLIHQT